MSLLTYNQLCNLIVDCRITAVLENVNAASIDVTLGDTILVENTTMYPSPVDLAAKETPEMDTHLIPASGFSLAPGEFALVNTVEKFYLPNNLAAEYKLKSSLARAGLDHALAGWCDPGWNGSVLTLEIRNTLQNHTLILKPGMKIGQVVFWEGEEVPEHASYAVKGQYNGDETVRESKGLR